VSTPSVFNPVGVVIAQYILTAREGEILTLIMQGRANLQIATGLGVSLKTVRNHVSNIFSKLQVVDRAHAVLRARRRGGISCPLSGQRPATNTWDSTATSATASW